MPQRGVLVSPDATMLTQSGASSTARDLVSPSSAVMTLAGSTHCGCGRWPMMPPVNVIEPPRPSRPGALSCYVVARIEQGVERFKDTRCVLLFHGLIPVTTPNARLWWEAPRRSRFAAPLFVNPVVDVQRTMDETDTCCLTLDKKAHHFDVHQTHFLQIQHNP